MYNINVEYIHNGDYWLGSYVYESEIVVLAEGHSKAEAQAETLVLVNEFLNRDFKKQSELRNEKKLSDQ